MLKVVWIWFLITYEEKTIVNWNILYITGTGIINWYNPVISSYMLLQSFGFGEYNFTCDMSKFMQNEPSFY